MTDSRMKNATRNMAYGVMYRGVATICPFVIRTLLLYTLGIEYLGLSSLFTSLLSILSLAELGIGNAMVYAMYKPIVEKNDEKICALLKLYRQLYKTIGTIILLVGLILLPFIDKLVKGSHPADINLYVLYIIYLINTVISYYLFGYKQSILLAYQRNDIISKRSMIIQLIMYISQACVLLLSKNYYLYIVLIPIFTVATNFANSIIVDKCYPQYTCKGEVSKETVQSIKKNILALIGGQLSNTVLSSSDSLVLSAFIGLTTVAIYGNYFYILSAIIGFTSIIYSSLTAGLGNSIVTESMEKNYSDFKLLSFMNAWLVGWCATCVLCLIQPFMLIWTGEKLMFGMPMVILFTVYLYIYQINKIVLTYKDAAGIWWQDRFRPYVIMTINLAFNIVSVQIIGIYGVILSTIISLCVSVPWSCYTVHKYLFKKNVVLYGIEEVGYLIISVVGGIATYLICNIVPGGKIIRLIFCSIICCILPNLLFIILNIKNPALKKCVTKIGQIIRGKI